MQDSVDWSDVEEIGVRLWEAEPTLDPLGLRFTDLLDRILALPGFSGSREESNEKRLEAVQMAWLEEFQDDR
jgi:FeS assembly protein IscX